MPVKESIYYHLFGPKEIESPQERLMRLCLRDIRDRIGRLEIHFQRSSSVVGIFSSILSDARVKLPVLSEIWIEFVDPPDGVPIIVPERTFQVCVHPFLPGRFSWYIY